MIHKVRSLATSIEKLEARCGYRSVSPRRESGSICAHEHVVWSRLCKWKVLVDETNFALMVSLKGEIRQNRVSRTIACCEIEKELSKVLVKTAIPEVVMAMLWDKLVVFFEAIHSSRPAWGPNEFDIGRVRRLGNGNSRLQFHAMRDALGALRILMHRLACAHQEGDSCLQELEEAGIVNKGKLLYSVANAAFGDIEEILSPPAHLRSIWKDVAKTRIAPEDGREHGEHTDHLWRTSSRVCDMVAPLVSEEEVKNNFGESATLKSHAFEKLPYVIGAHKYSLVEGDPVVVSATDQGLYMLSGPSGTAYRFLSLWLVLSGSEDQLPLIQFAVAGLLLNGRHHSLIEVLMVCSSLLGNRPPRNILEMMHQLVPRALECTWEGTRYRVETDWFYQEVTRRVQKIIV